MRRTIAVLLAVVVLAVVAPATRAEARTPCWASALRCWELNAKRSQAGVAPLAQRRSLQGVAVAWAAQMAASRVLAHNPALTSQVDCWRRIGENVGTSMDDLSVLTAFMDSAPHRANILDPRFTQVGIGARRSPDGRLWVVHVFRKPTKTCPSHR
jgi:uncharacterized protein YkwD